MWSFRILCVLGVVGGCFGGHGWGWKPPPPKIINRDVIHKHFLHVHNIHRHQLNRHNVHQHNLHKHNVHLEHVPETVVHNYHETQTRVHPHVKTETQVIPHHETVYKQHEHHVKVHPVVIEHNGWAQPSHHHAAAVTGAQGWNAWAETPETDDYQYHGYKRRMDTDVETEVKKEEVKPAPVEQKKETPVKKA